MGHLTMVTPPPIAEPAVLSLVKHRSAFTLQEAKQLSYKCLWQLSYIISDRCGWHGNPWILTEWGRVSNPVKFLANVIDTPQTQRPQSQTGDNTASSCGPSIHVRLHQRDPGPSPTQDNCTMFRPTLRFWYIPMLVKSNKCSTLIVGRSWAEGC
jgi:hypothetical protein